MPYFFIASGFFLGKKLSAQKKIEEEKAAIAASLKKFVRLYIIFGGWYLFCNVAKALLVESNKLESIGILFHTLLVETPGGAIWYVYTLIWAMAILYIIRRKKTSFVLLSTVFFCTYLFGSVFFMKLYSNCFLQSLYRKYFLADRNLLFFGVYIFGGIALGYNGFDKINMSRTQKITGVISFIIYIVYGLNRINFDSVLSTVLFAGIKCVACFLLFVLSLNIKIVTEKALYYRSMSMVIYFTHWNFIYLFLIAKRVVNVNRVILSLMCTALAVLFAEFIVKYKNGKFFRILFG